jgi:hypothetical protein
MSSIIPILAYKRRQEQESGNPGPAYDRGDGGDYDSVGLLIYLICILLMIAVIISSYFLLSWLYPPL